MKILLTGATGFIGGRLIPQLLAEDHQVRVLVRDPKRISGRIWTSKVEVYTGDLLQRPSIHEALDGIETAYYLVHSMRSGRDFAELDRVAAKNFVSAAGQLKHLIYLGGLLPEEGTQSHHLQSRTEVGQILREALPTTEFRAGPIIGSGSASFEMLRYLTERLPLMIAPKWIKNEIQPIAIRDVLAYLLAVPKIPPAGIIDIGADRLTFKRMMTVFAEVRGLHRSIFSVPILAPGLASRWVGLVTPIPNSMAVPIIEGIIQPLLADTTKAERLFPQIHPIPYKRAIELALARLQTGATETRWSGALGKAPDPYSIKNKEGMIREVRHLKVSASPSALFHTFSRLGGHRGWPVWNWAWVIRGFIDRLIGGPGLRRGRRHPVETLPGEVIDFWRVEAVEANHLLRLRAEMKLPGRAWIEWEATSNDSGGAILTQIASFAPKGLAGLFYWYSLYPIHALIFSAMIKAIAREAETVKDRP